MENKNNLIQDYIDNYITFYEEDWSFDWILSNEKIFFSSMPFKFFKNIEETKNDFIRSIEKININEIEIIKEKLTTPITLDKNNIIADYICKVFDKETKEIYMIYFYVRKYENLHIDFIKNKNFFTYFNK